jgi:Cu/Ag efflux protein CusF
MTRTLVFAVALFAAAGCAERPASERADAAVEQAYGLGAVQSVDEDARTVTIAHEPIDAIGWGAMTMAFPVGEDVDIAALAPGDEIAFKLAPAAGGGWRVAGACRMEGADRSMMRSMMSADRGAMMMDMPGGAMARCALGEE